MNRFATPVAALLGYDYRTKLLSVLPPPATSALISMPHPNRPAPLAATLLLSLAVLLAPVITQPNVSAQDASAAHPGFTADVVYGHKMGMALTFDVFRPTVQSNAAGVLFIVSGGFFSHWAPPEQMAVFAKPLNDAGFTVFTVRHGSSPKFEIPEIVDDVRRSVRFIRAKASQFGVNPDRLGVYGMSAGGHLSLMLGTTGDDGDDAAADPIDRVSSRVQAVTAWVAPTDLTIAVHEAPESLPAYRQFPALGLPLAQAKDYSPLFQVTPRSAPTLLLVGEQDDLVPKAHSERIYQAFIDNGVPARLKLYPKSGHGFTSDEMPQAIAEMVKWFQQHLLPAK